MLKVALILVALLATDGAVFAYPVPNARGYGYPDVVPRAVPGKMRRRAVDPITLHLAPWSLEEELYEQIVDSLNPAPGLQRPRPAKPRVTVTAVATAKSSDQEGIESQDYWDEDENYSNGHELDDGLVEREYGREEVNARDLDGAMVTLVPRRRGRGRNKNPIVATPQPGPVKHSGVGTFGGTGHGDSSKASTVHSTAFHATGQTTPITGPHVAGQPEHIHPTGETGHIHPPGGTGGPNEANSAAQKKVTLQSVLQHPNTGALAGSAAVAATAYFQEYSANHGSQASQMGGTQGTVGDAGGATW